MTTKDAHRVADSLQRIERLVGQREGLTLNLAADFLSKSPCLKVGKSRVGANGNFVKPEHIETFIGFDAVTHVFHTILAALPVEVDK